MVVFVLANLAYPESEGDAVWTLMFLAIVVAFVLVGALLTVRVPGNRIGPMLLGAAGLLATTVALGTFALVGARSGEVPSELVAIAALLNDLGFLWPIIVVLIGIPLIFPDGHLLSGRWRWIVVLCVVALASQAIAQVIGPGELTAAGLPNPFEVPALAPLAEVLDAFASWSSIVGFGAAVAAVIVRYGRSDEVERHQLKWLIAVAAVAAVAFPVAFIVPFSLAADAAFMIGLLALLALPLAIGVAILRYRLYDIDRLISRTIGWGLVTGLLVASFAGLVIGLQALLAGFTQGETVAVAASTLVALGLFQPVRRTVQRAVDRRFDRARYDGDRTAAAFADRLRSEVDLDAVADDLTGSVDRALRPATLALWLRGPVR